MKARLAKKILLGSEKKKRYWTKRVIKASFGWKEDHRVVKHFKFIIAREEERRLSYE